MPGPVVSRISDTVLLSVLVARQTPDQLYAAVPEYPSLARFRSGRKLRGLRVDNQMWRYVSFGSGDRVLVFLHGMAGAYDIWWQQLDALSNRFRVVSFTYPAVSSLTGLHRGIMAILDAEEVGRFSVIGSSLGGYLAQYLVATEGGRIDRAVFGNTFPPNDLIEAENGRTAAIGRLVPERVVMHAFRRNVVTSVVPAAGGSSLVRAYLFEQSYGQMSKAQFLARYRCVIDSFDPVEPSMPHLIIESDNDPLVSRELREMLRRTYRSATVHTFHSTGHFTYLNAPNEYTGVLTQFLEEG
jgi:pimeloyl-ACP methyl ester carboxylesterase